MSSIELDGFVTALMISIVILLLWLVRVHRRKVVTGDLGIVGETGVALTDINPEGQVFIHGEWWKARSEARIPAGTNVRVIGVERLRLCVEAMSPVLPRPASAVDDSEGASHQMETSSRLG